jgi:hypothetical protein
MKQSQGFWTGLGIALIVAAFMAPISIMAIADGNSKTECAKQHGQWKNNSCTFPSAENKCKDICLGA